MTTGNNWESEDDEGTPNDDGQQQAKPKGTGLRAHADQVKRENDELKARVEKFEQAERTRNVQTAIKAKGYDPEIADLVPEKVASDTAELDKWLESKGKLFKVSGQEETAEADGEEESELGEEQDVYNRMSRVSSSALNPTKQADAMSSIKNTKSRAELDQLMRKFGNQNIL